MHEDAEKNLVMTFEFPGVSKDDVQFNFQNGNLTVSAETKKYEEHADNGYTLRCIKISHTIRLLQGIQVCGYFENILEWMSSTDLYVSQDEHIKAIKENGLLTVTVTSPKSLPELAPKKITILDL